MITVVECLKGKEKGQLFAVVDQQENRLMLADGKARRLEHPKCKNKKHVTDTGVTLDESCIQTNRSLRKALKAVDR